jgi:hypothetical protein
MSTNGARRPLAAIGGLDDLMALTSQHQRHQPAQVAIAVRVQDAQRRARLALFVRIWPRGILAP